MQFTKKAKKQIIICLLSLVFVMISHRLILQFWPVKVYVGVRAPLPAIFAESLRDTGSTLTNYFAFVPYEQAEDKKVSGSDIRKVRSKIAWQFFTFFPPDSLEVNSSDVITSSHRIDRTRVRQVRFKRVGRDWQATKVLTGVEDLANPTKT